MATLNNGKRLYMEVDIPEKNISSKKSFGANSRTSYDASFKLKVIKEAEQQGNNLAASKKYGVSECNVRRWRKDKQKFLKVSSTRKTFRGAKTGKFPEVDNEVLNYCKDLRNQGFPVNREVLQIKAAQTARSLGITRQEFKASVGWVKRFMKRSGLSLRRRTSLAQKLPEEYEHKLTEYQRYVIQLRQTHNHDISQIGNADETPVFFDMPSNTTIDTKGKKSILIKTAGHEKKRCTVMLGATADGRKLPPFVIFKRKTMPQEQFPKGIFVRVQEKGWMDEQLMLDWLKVVWERRPGALLAKRGLISLDAFQGHLTNAVKERIKSHNSDMIVIPGGMTSQLQVMDVSINKPFKDYLRAEYKEWLINTKHDLTPAGKIRKPSCALICQWIVSAWSSIKTETIIRGFKKCCLSNALDGSEDGILWEDSSNNSSEESEASDYESPSVESDDE